MPRGVAGQGVLPGMPVAAKRKRVVGARAIPVALVTCRFCKRPFGAHAGGLGCAL